MKPLWQTPLFLASLTLFLVIVTGGALGADAPAAWNPGLSDRELAVQRWLSAITIGQDRTADEWPVWYEDEEQTDLKSLRYQLAFAGYGCAAQAAKTPAYRDLASRQLQDICQRMIDRRVWRYVSHYWNYGEGPPDPCLFENVMYTGHLAQLMCLYELLSGDDRYATAGWDFVSSDGRKVHYTLRSAVERMHRQSVGHESGGVCCEPGLCFAVCNSHNATAYRLFDLLHGTNYAEVNRKWFDWMSQRYRNTVPFSRDLLYVLYSQKEKVFVPVGDVGADAWALGWGLPWFPEVDFAAAGWEHLKRHARWERPQDGQLYAANGPLLRHFTESTVGTANAFLAVLAVQMEGQDGEHAKPLLAWMETQFGREIDLDGDGHAESYYFDTLDQRHVASTGNMAVALAGEQGSLRKFYTTSRRDLLSQPTLARVDHPRVLVRAAEYRAPILRFVVLSGQRKAMETTRLVCENIPPAARVTRDGEAFDGFRQTGTRLEITTDLDREHVFEIVVQPAQ